MKKERTLREKIESQKRLSKILFFIIIPVLAFIISFLIGFLNTGKNVSILGLFDKQQENVEKENEESKNLESEATIIDNTEDSEDIEEDTQEETSPPPNPHPQSTNSIPTQEPEVTQTVETSPPTEDKCTDNLISYHRQQILSAQTRINSAQNYISNPTCDSSYSFTLCQLTYNVCVNDVETWFEADGTCSRLPRSGACRTLRVERQNKLDLCLAQFNYCNLQCENEINQITEESYQIIEESEEKINASELFLKDCGINL